MTFDLDRDVADAACRDRTRERFRRAGVRLPKLSELAAPVDSDGATAKDLASLDPDAPAAGNLFRMHWHNDADRRNIVPVPAHLVLPGELTGVEATIIVALGNRFPLIRAHKVLAAYGCLVPRLVTGGFDPERHRAVWPSTGNYCRGGVAISRILGCRSVAVAARRHESGALRMAGELGHFEGRHRAHAGNREQRQGDLRRLPPSRQGPRERDLQPVPGVRKLRRPPRRDRSGPGAHVPGRQGRGQAEAPRLRLGLGAPPEPWPRATI